MKILRDRNAFLSGFYYEEPMAELPAMTHCGEVLCFPGHHLESHKHTGFEFLYLARGSVSWSVRGRTLTQKEGDLIAFFPGELHSTLHPARKETHQLWIGLDLDNYNTKGRHLARLLRLKKVRCLHECGALEPVLRAIRGQIIRQLPAQKDVVGAYLDLLVRLIEQNLRLQYEPSGKRITPYSYGVEKALAYMASRLDRRIPVSELAAVATIRQASHFCTRFRREVGATPAAHHLHLRLMAARDSLLQNNLNFTQAALRYGFSSSQHFSTSFRRAFHTTPRRWRERHGGGWPSVDS